MKAFIAIALLTSITTGISYANAMPRGPATTPNTSDMVQVSGGCGQGFHRDPRGVCRRNGMVTVPLFSTGACRPGFVRGPHGRCVAR